MFLSIPIIPVLILNEFTTKKKPCGYRLDSLMFKPGKEPGSVRVFASDGYDVLEFFFPDAVFAKESFTEFSLNVSGTIRGFKLKGNESLKLTVTTFEDRDEAEVYIDPGEVTFVPIGDGVFGIDCVWMNLKEASKNQENKRGNEFSVPWEKYKKFFFDKHYPGVHPLFVRYGDMTLVKYSKEEIPYSVRGITGQTVFPDTVFDNKILPEWL